MDILMRMHAVMRTLSQEGVEEQWPLTILDHQGTSVAIPYT